MKNILFSIIISCGSCAFACINLSGTYQIKDTEIRVRLEQNGCTSTRFDGLDENGNVIASKTLYYDGVLRDESWPSYEKYSGIFQTDHLYEVFYDKDTGLIVESKTYARVNGDLVAEQTHTLPNKPSYHQIYYWIKQ